MAVNTRFFHDFVGHVYAVLEFCANYRFRAPGVCILYRRLCASLILVYFPVTP
jgi:hypothetical protein